MHNDGFYLVSHVEKDSWTVLKNDRMRHRIEGSYRVIKGELDGKSVRMDDGQRPDAGGACDCGNKYGGYGHRHHN